VNEMARSSRPIGRPRHYDNSPPTKTLILDEATKMYLSKGYQAVSMDDVAKQCGFTKATVYYHYPTKADLFTDAMIQLMNRIKSAIIKILSINKPLKERLTDIALNHLLATEDLDISSFMKEAKTSLPKEHLMQIEKAEEEMYEVLAQGISDAIKIKEVPPSPPILAAHAFMAYLTTGRQLMESRNLPYHSLEELVDQIVTFYWNGLGH